MIVLIDGGGVDWLISMFVLNVEYFNIFDLFYKMLILFDSWVIEGIDWVVIYFCFVFQGVCVLVDYIFNGF